MRWNTIGASIAFTLLAIACGPGIDRQDTLNRLRTSIEAEIESETQLEDHNQLVEDAVAGSVFHGMRRHEVQAALGRGQECGVRDMCRRQGFNPTDWTYEIGRQDGLPAGPTLIIGFDRQGIVDGAFYLTRR